MERTVEAQFVAPDSFMILPPEIRLMIYEQYIQGLEATLDHFMIVERQLSAARAVQVLNVGSGWTHLLGINRTIRSEVSRLFWKANLFRLYPKATHLLSPTAKENIRHIFLDAVVLDSLLARRHTYRIADLIDGFPALLKSLQSLQTVHLCIDEKSLRSCLDPDGDTFCDRHAATITHMEPELTKILSAGPGRYWTQFFNFRLDLTDASRGESKQEFGPQHQYSNKLAYRWSRASIHADPNAGNELRLCNQLSCRLLKAVHSLYETADRPKNVQIYFIMEYADHWTSNSISNSPWRGYPPLNIDARDLREARRTTSTSPTADESTLDVQYLAMHRDCVGYNHNWLARKPTP